MSDTITDVSGLDDLFHDVTLTDVSTGAALTTGSVTVVLCTHRTTTSLGTGATCTLTHTAAGRWTGVHDDADISLAIAALPNGAYFDRVLRVQGMAGRKLGTCRKVVAVAEG